MRMDNPYNFGICLTRIKDEHLKIIKEQATIEKRAAEQSIKACPKAEREYHLGNRYVKQLQESLFYPDNGKKPWRQMKMIFNFIISL